MKYSVIVFLIERKKIIVIRDSFFADDKVELMQKIHQKYPNAEIIKIHHPKTNITITEEMYSEVLFTSAFLSIKCEETPSIKCREK